MKKTMIVFLCVVLYLVTSVPVGLFLYSAKSEYGIDVFKRTGFHGYLSCLQEQAGLIGNEKPQKEG